MDSVKAYIGLGSNVGDGKHTLQNAWTVLGEYEGLDCVTLSSPYLSAPVGMVSENWFTNAVGVVATTMEPVELLRTLLEIEAAFGRRRPENSTGYQDRSLDLDLLYFGDIVMAFQELILPHPHIPERLFVLEPLAELAPGILDHKRGLTPAEMIAQFQSLVAEGGCSKQELTRSSWIG